MFVRQYARTILGITETQVVISVGQFIPRKGFDVLLKAASRLPHDIGFYIIGGETTEEYLQMKQELNLTNVHFIGFKTKRDLALYYQAANCVAFPTREDIWGLITNEAMAVGLPVVATDKCISALEMIENGINGYIVPSGDNKSLSEKINDALTMNAFAASLDTAMKFTTERMVETHIKVFDN